MNLRKLIAIALITAGSLGLAYGGFTYTTATHEVEAGPLAIAINQNKSVEIPVWAGLGAVLVGSFLLLLGSRSSRA